MQNGAVATPSIRRLDEIDLRLLAALREDGRTSQEDLSRRLALSRPAIRDRMRRLEAIGILLGYTIVVDWELLGYPILAFVNVRTAMGTCGEATRIVNALSNHGAVVEECYPITGEWCMLAKVRARTSKDLANFLDEIKKDPHFSATSTTLALSTVRLA
ncbi:MAG TPA: Lrp/AsnC family transcriptional regulator [Candidatus Aquilonibacter sp.]